MEKEKRKLGIEKWSSKSLNSFREVIKAHCPNGVHNCCDGRPIERGYPWKDKCKYFLDGRCTQDNIVGSRAYAEAAARRANDE